MKKGISCCSFRSYTYYLYEVVGLDCNVEVYCKLVATWVLLGYLNNFLGLRTSSEVLNKAFRNAHTSMNTIEPFSYDCNRMMRSVGNLHNGYIMLHGEVRCR